jgi:O-methyltransferase
MQSNLFIAEFFQKQGCLNIEQGVNLWFLLNEVLSLGIPGDVVELGSLTGMTAAVMARTLQERGSDRTLWLFDSFKGLPVPTPEDGNCPLIPENFATDPAYTRDRFATLGLPQPAIIDGWFCDTLEKHLPPCICFAHLDADLYSSTCQGLTAIYPRLAPGAIVLVDDYARPDVCELITRYYGENPYVKNSRRKVAPTDWLPGVRLACEEFLAERPEEMTVLIAGEERHAFFRRC